MKTRILQLLGAGSISLLLAAGCTTPRAHGPAERPGAALVVAMQGDALFFDGTVRAEASVSRIAPGRRSDAGGGGGGGHRGGGRRHGGGDYTRPATEGDEGRSGLPRMTGPALTLRIKLENRSAQPVEVQILDVSSELGSFAVRPERLLVAPGQSSEVDPMVSQLGVIAAEIPVTLVLRTGGKSETQVLRVRAVAPARPELTRASAPGGPCAGIAASPACRGLPCSRSRSARRAPA
jgi:hypothetical protein